MNHAEKDIELIEKYFDEELSEYEAENFERRMKTDEGFRTLVEQEKYVIGAIRIQGLKDEMEQLKRLEAGLADPQTAVRQYGNLRWYILAAAVIALLIIARFALMPAVTTQDVYASNFRPYLNVFEPTVRGEARTSDRAEAFKAYDRKDYAQAATLFRATLQSNNDPEALLLLGNCNLMIGNTDEAIQNFSRLTRDSKELSLQASWYLSLAYLKNDDKQSAVPLLETLASSKSSYASKAKEILDQLE